MAISDINIIDHQSTRDFVGNCSLGNAGLLEGTNATTFKTQYAVSFRIGGQCFYKAATDNIAFTATAQQASGTTAYYLFTINASGTITVTKGTDGSTTLPDCPDDEAPLGVLKLVLGATTFTGGTTDLGAANVTDTWAHINYMPVDNDASALTFA